VVCNCKGFFGKVPAAEAPETFWFRIEWFLGVNKKQGTGRRGRAPWVRRAGVAGAGPVCTGPGFHGSPGSISEFAVDKLAHEDPGTLPAGGEASPAVDGAALLVSEPRLRGRFRLLW